MTDGPFRNLPLSSRWKDYGEALISDAISPGERAAKAAHSMIGDVNVGTISSLLTDLKNYASRPQMDLLPVTAFDAIFESHPISPLVDDIQKRLATNLRDRIPPLAALDQALTESATEWINTTKNRLDEECIRARDLGDMSLNEYRKGLERNGHTFAILSADSLCEALMSGDKRAFKKAIQKKRGVDEGPEE